MLVAILVVIFVIVILTLNSSVSKKSKQSTPKTSSASPKHIYRNNNLIEADEVNDAWGSGNLEDMLAVLNVKTNLIDRHFLLMNIVNLTYKKRVDPKMARKCASIARKHISEFPKIKQALLEDFNGILPRVTTFQHYATLLTELGEYEEAINVCKKAIKFGLKDNTTSGFIGRIERIEKKMI